MKITKEGWDFLNLTEFPDAGGPKGDLIILLNELSLRDNTSYNLLYKVFNENLSRLNRATKEAKDKGYIEE